MTNKYMDMSVEELKKVDIEGEAKKERWAKAVKDAPAASAAAKAVLDANPKKRESNWVTNLQKKVKTELNSGKPKAKAAPKSGKVEAGLKTAGMTPDEIKRLKGKK